MRIDPGIAQLRADPAQEEAVQAAMQSELAAWLATQSVAAIQAGRDEYARGADLAHIPALDKLLSDGAAAACFLAEWSRRFARAIRSAPLALSPFQHSASPGLTTIRLADSGPVTLSVLCYEEMTEAQAQQSAFLVDEDRHEIIVAGRGWGEEVHVSEGAALPQRAHRQWQVADTIDTCGAAQSRVVQGVEGHLAVLQLVRAPDDPQPTRQISLTDGTVMHRASSNKRESQDMMAIAVLGAMGRSDAAPVIARHAQSGAAHARWEAMRHTLALDTQAGLVVLEAMAAEPGDLREPARSLLAALHAQHPELSAMRGELCLA